MWGPARANAKSDEVKRDGRNERIAGKGEEGEKLGGSSSSRRLYIGRSR